MSSLHDLLLIEHQAAVALGAAKSAHKDALMALHGGLKNRHEKYQTLFEPLYESANAIGQPISEVGPEGFHDSHIGWGNNGLKQVINHDGGFTHIVTSDVFRGESSTCVSYIPTKYLGEDGDAVMQEDFARVQSHLAQLLDAEKQKRDKDKEKKELSELKRLQDKYSTQ